MGAQGVARGAWEAVGGSRGRPFGAPGGPERERWRFFGHRSSKGRFCEINCFTVMKGTFCHMKRVPGDRKRDEKEPRGENGAGGGREAGLGGQ